MDHSSSINASTDFREISFRLFQGLILKYQVSDLSGFAFFRPDRKPIVTFTPAAEEFEVAPQGASASKQQTVGLFRCL